MMTDTKRKPHRAKRQIKQLVLLTVMTLFICSGCGNRGQEFKNIAIEHANECRGKLSSELIISSYLYIFPVISYRIKCHDIDKKEFLKDTQR